MESPLANLQTALFQKDCLDLLTGDVNILQYVWLLYVCAHTKLEILEMSSNRELSM